MPARMNLLMRARRAPFRAMADSQSPSAGQSRVFRLMRAAIRDADPEGKSGADRLHAVLNGHLIWRLGFTPIRKTAAMVRTARLCLVIHCAGLPRSPVPPGSIGQLGSGMVHFLAGVRASFHIQRLRPPKMTTANALGHNGIG